MAANRASCGPVIVRTFAKRQPSGLPRTSTDASFGTPRRSFDLVRSDLTNQWLFARDLQGADLGFANLMGMIHQANRPQTKRSY